MTGCCGTQARSAVVNPPRRPDTTVPVPVPMVPARTPSTVLLPAPLAPSSAVIRPAGAVKLSGPTAASLRPPNRTVSPSTVTAGGPAADPAADAGASGVAPGIREDRSGFGERGTAFVAGVVCCAKLPERQVAVGSQDERQQPCLKRHVAVNQADADEHGDHRDGNG